MSSLVVTEVTDIRLWGIVNKPLLAAAIELEDGRRIWYKPMRNARGHMHPIYRTCWHG